MLKAAVLFACITSTVKLSSCGCNAGFHEVYQTTSPTGNIGACPVPEKKCGKDTDSYHVACCRSTQRTGYYINNCYVYTKRYCGARTFSSAQSLCANDYAYLCTVGYHEAGCTVGSCGTNEYFWSPSSSSDLLEVDIGLEGDSENANGTFPTGWARYANNGTTGLLCDNVTFSSSYAAKFSGTGSQLIEAHAAGHALPMYAEREYHFSFAVYSTGSSSQTLRSEFLVYPSDLWTAGGSTLGGANTSSGSDSGFVKYHCTSKVNEWESFIHILTPSQTYDNVRVNLGPVADDNDLLYIDATILG
ncbi:hypothetical protein CYMTET_12378 [Cymbomonas tetramitiformis]|uniref:CBM-cenC domain-containing protein n=1 Tax=Cymbomonas tetramitiformis TaxID=36881 RepID=A0AAE0LCI2_9CHLO|nr:hypothetical protein CYMTET_12378 [Cymbomonas tetramitiformis]